MQREKKKEKNFSFCEEKRNVYYIFVFIYLLCILLIQERFTFVINVDYNKFDIF